MSTITPMEPMPTVDPAWVPSPQSLYRLSIEQYEDRGMAHIYGRGGVPIYWIVNLVDRQVEVHTDPGPGGYRSRQILKPGGDLPVDDDGAELGRIAVADIMPRRPLKSG